MREVVAKPITEPSEAVSMLDAVGDWLEQVAKVAQKLTSFASLILILGLFAVAVVGFKVYSPDGWLWWNILKITIIALPLLVWFIFWQIIQSLADAPQSLKELATVAGNSFNKSGVQSSVDQPQAFKQPRGIFSLLSSVRQMRNTEGVESLFDTISGIALLANPLFAIAVVLALFATVITILLAPIVLLIL